MMDKNTFDSLKKSISEERLAVYRADGVDDTTAIARYIYNIALCKSLYPLINIFEVTLRNSIDKALEKYFNQPDWNNVIHLNQTELMMINDAMLKIKRQGKKYSHGRLIAEITLGFWVALHERISHWKDLKQKHDLILDFIKWLNPDMYTIASEKDTFNDIYTDGVKPFVAFVNDKL